MSLLSRIAARAVEAPDLPLLEPKAQGLERMLHASPAEEGPPDNRSPAHTDLAEDEPVPQRALARETAPEAAQDEAAAESAPAMAPARAARAAAPNADAPPLPPEPEAADPAAARLRRTEAAGGAEAPDPMEEPAPPVSRAVAPSPEDPMVELPHPALADEPPPNRARALRREAMAPPMGAAEATPVVEASYDTGHHAGYEAAPASPFDAPAPAEPSPFAPTSFETHIFHATPSPAPATPQVIVEQVDVLIHEPAPPPAPLSVFGRGSLDTRYVRSL